MKINIGRTANEIELLKDQLHKHDKAIARIKTWHQRQTRKENTQAREVEKLTLETVLRIFENETKWAKR